MNSPETVFIVLLSKQHSHQGLNPNNIQVEHVFLSTWSSFSSCVGLISEELCSLPQVCSVMLKEDV